MPIENGFMGDCFPRQGESALEYRQRSAWAHASSDKRAMVKRLSILSDCCGPEVAASRAIYVPESIALHPWALPEGTYLEHNPFYCRAEEWAYAIKTTLPLVHEAILWLVDTIEGFASVRHFYQMNGLIESHESP